MALCGATQAAAAAPPVVEIGADAWLTQDLMRRTLTVHQPPPAVPLQFRVPGFLRVDLNVDAGVVCGRDTDHLWLLDLASRQLVWQDVASDGAVPRPEVAVARTGACATPAGDTSLLVLSRSGQASTTRLLLPKGATAFDWRSLRYDDAHDLYLATGADTYAVIPATGTPASVTVKGVTGKLRQGSIEDTHFSSFGCCAPQLSTDGRTMYTVAGLGDDNMTGFTGVAAIDVATGRYQRMVLPAAPAWLNTGRHVSQYGKEPWFTLAGATDYHLWPQRQGAELVLEGYAGTSAEHDAGPGLLNLDLVTGQIRATPALAKASFKGLTRSGRHVLWRSRDDTTVLTRFGTQELLAEHPGEVLAVAHARQASAKLQLPDASPHQVLAYRSARPAALGFESEQLAKLGTWLRRAKSLYELRLKLGDAAFRRPDPKTGRSTAIQLGEVIVHAQGLPLPQPGPSLPGLQATHPENQQAWADYATACDTYAQPQGDAAPLALLQCLTAPW